MTIERTEEEIIIRIPSTVETNDIQDFIDYMRYKELGQDVEVPQAEIDKLATELNTDWWKINRERFIK